jgi:hypothetical protein
MGQAVGAIGSGLGKVGSAIGSTTEKLVGHIDPDATNTVDANGNVVATGTEGGKVVADPKMGLSTGQMVLRGAMSGLGKGLQQRSQQQQQGQGGGMAQFGIGQPQMPADVYQTSNYLDEARQRLQTPNAALFYGGR